MLLDSSFCLKEEEANSFVALVAMGGVIVTSPDISRLLTI